MLGLILGEALGWFLRKSLPFGAFYMFSINVFSFYEAGSNGKDRTLLMRLEVRLRLRNGDAQNILSVVLACCRGSDTASDQVKELRALTKSLV